VPKRVLFLCSGNSARSQMAEGLLRHLGSNTVEAFSAGTAPAPVLHPLAIETMAERGIDITHQRTKPLSEFDGQTFDLLITVCDDANEACPIYEGARQRLHWSLPDPAKATGTEQERKAAFRSVADELTRRIGALMEAV
jgi:arsenate reductase